MTNKQKRQVENTLVIGKLDIYTHIISVYTHSNTNKIAKDTYSRRLAVIEHLDWLQSPVTKYFSHNPLK